MTEIDRDTYTIERRAPKTNGALHGEDPPQPDNLDGYVGGREHRVKEKEPAPATITASPFSWIDPATIPRRRWLYGRHMIRAYAGATIAPGGVGKSSLLICEALAIVTGRDLLGMEPNERANVWIWNGEDPLDELQRRVTAAMLHHQIDEPEVAGRLFLDTGRRQEIIIAEQGRDGTKIATPLEKRLIEQISANKIGLLIIDPFVSSHRVTENDNNAIDAVAKTWARIADVTGCAIELVHHVRKTNGAEVTVEDGRGASALIAAVRSARVLNQMSAEEAERAGVENRRTFFKVENGKANLTIPSDKAAWFQLASVELGNGEETAFGREFGDNVGVVAKWEWPSPFEGMLTSDLVAVQKRISEGEWRESSQAADWAGKAVAEVMRLDLNDKRARQRVSELLRIWIANKALKVTERPDEKRRPRRFIEVGELAT